jgi:hypothetical protein
MTKRFLKVLPLAAAVLLATSCSKDDNNEEVNIENQPKAEKVVIPFSVKVNTGNSISKIAYTQDGNDVSKFNVNFTDDDVNTIKMHIVSADNIEETDLVLDKEGDNFIFKGEITLAEDKTEEDFNNGFDITGSFGEAGTSIVTSTTSLADAMGNCSHQYTSTFSSNDATINLDDNYAYLEMSCSAQQTKFQLTIGDNTADYTPNANKKIWIAVPKGTQVTGNLVKTMAVEGGKVYRADRTDVVDLGPSVSVVWTTANAGSYVAGADAMAAVTSTYGENSGYRLPTETELNFLISSASLTYSGTTYTFETQYGSISLSAGGFKESANGATQQSGQVGYYWANTSTNAICIDLVNIKSVYVGSWSDKYFLVRAVRQLN